MSVAMSFTSYFGDFAVATLIFSLIEFNFFLLSIFASFYEQLVADCHYPKPSF